MRTFQAPAWPTHTLGQGPGPVLGDGQWEPVASGDTLNEGLARRKPAARNLHLLPQAHLDTGTPTPGLQPQPGGSENQQPPSPQLRGHRLTSSPRPAPPWVPGAASLAVV